MIQNLVIRGSVIGSTPFCRALRKKGTTDPRLPTTFPYLTTLSSGPRPPAYALAATKSLSEQSLVAPYKLIGFAALSVDSARTFSTPVLRAASMTFCPPNTLVLMHSKGLYSAAGTCFKAAA